MAGEYYEVEVTVPGRDVFKILVAVKGRTSLDIINKFVKSTKNSKLSVRIESDVPQTVLNLLCDDVKLAIPFTGIIYVFTERYTKDDKKKAL